MKEILKSDLPLEYQNFWHNIGVELEKYINGVVRVFFDTFTNFVEIRVFIKNFNYSMYFTFPYNNFKYDDKDLVQHMLNGIQFRLYKEVFKNEKYI